jgi:hypothetical protein
VCVSVRACVYPTIIIIIIIIATLYTRTRNCVSVRR